MQSNDVRRALIGETGLALAILAVLAFGIVLLSWLLGLRLWPTILAAPGIALLAFAILEIGRVKTGHRLKAATLQQGAVIAIVGVVVVAGLSFGTLRLFGNTPISAFRASVVERLGGETPQAKVAAYMRAIVLGDEASALEAWTLPDYELPDGRGDALRERRDAVTGRLIDAGLDTAYQIGHIEWWRTCCEPGVTTDARSAGGARIQVQLLDQEGAPHIYVFDVFNQDGAYWGGAMGYPVRHWVLRDVYLNGEEPLYMRYVYEPSTRLLPWPPEATETP